MIEHSISIVLPIYNEEGNISEVINRILRVLPGVADTFEIIAVDDGSVDKTAAILKGIESSDSRIKVIRHCLNEGYGAALTSGFRKAKNEFILMMDSDRQFDISEVTKFIPYMQNYDFVIGFRMNRSDPLYRCILGGVFNFITRIFFGVNTKDINCGFKLFKASLLHKMVLFTKGALINAEILSQAQKNKVRVKEIEVQHYPRVYGKQTGAAPRVILNALLDIFLLRMRL